MKPAIKILAILLTFSSCVSAQYDTLKELDFPMDVDVIDSMPLNYPNSEFTKEDKILNINNEKSETTISEKQSVKSEGLQLNSTKLVNKDYKNADEIIIVATKKVNTSSVKPIDSVLKENQKYEILQVDKVLSTNTKSSKITISKKQIVKSEGLQLNSAKLVNKDYKNSDEIIIVATKKVNTSSVKPIDSILKENQKHEILQVNKVLSTNTKSSKTTISKKQIVKSEGLQLNSAKLVNEDYKNADEIIIVATKKVNTSSVKPIDSVLKSNPKTKIKKADKFLNNNTIEVVKKVSSNVKDSIRFSDLTFKPLHRVDLYKTNKQHTLIVEILNNGNQLDSLTQNIILPNKWKLVSLSSLSLINKNEKKLLFISFHIPSNFKFGKVKATLQIKNKLNTIIGSFDVFFNVAKNTNLHVFNIYAPQHVEAGKLIETSFAIENKGNVTQEISVKSRNTIVGKNAYKIAPDSTVVVKLNQKTNAKTYSFRSVATGLEVTSSEFKKVLKSYKSVSVFPIKIKQKDPYFRFPISTSLYYNSYSSNSEHYAAMSAEVTGNGYLDVARNHYLDFIVIGPKELNRKRFSVVDQYSFIYSFKNETKIYLGDHAFQINRLGFTNKYGMGFKIDQKVNNVILSVFYTKPRLYDYNSGAVYGIKGTYFASDKISAGISLTKSEDILLDNRRTNISGEIVTADIDYRDDTTTILGESSISFNEGKTIDAASYLSINKRFNKLTYAGNYIISGKNYLGAINNSLQVTNNLFYTINKLTFGFGHTVSKVNRKLDPMFYATEPYYENMNLSLNYRFSQFNTIRLGLYNRKRQDKLIPKNYDYNERGIKYSYNFRTKNNVFSGNFNGRFSKTRNLLSTNVNYRSTYANNVNLSYRITNRFNVRTKFSHNLNNRYGNANTNENFYRYGAGFSYRATNNINFNANYNSGFSPEQSYLKRDFININMMAKISNNHMLEFRANYFENPGEIDKKQVLAFAKYTYTFGAPLKKIIKQGGLTGSVFSLDKTVNIKGIKIIAAGKTVLTDKNGNFELNNLSLGKNYLLVDQSTLENGIITSAKIPYEVIIKDNSQANINIELVKSSSLKGKFWIDLEKIKFRNSDYNLQGYIKIQNKDFTYYTGIDKNGEFKFQEIVPGNYKLTILSFSSNNAEFVFDTNIQILLFKGETTFKKIELKLKERKIKFKNKNFKIGK